MNKISVYEAKYGRQFEVPNLFRQGTCLGSARERLAVLIDSAWKHSWHWSDDHNTFLDQAQSDLIDEISRAKDRLRELEVAQEILSAIERQVEDCEIGQ